MANEIVSAARLRELLTYDPETGYFAWRTGRRVGLPVGSISSLGYLRMQLLGRQYRANRLAWFLMTESWPTNHIDHINGIRTDNRWCNLRDITAGQNQQNQRAARATNPTGLLGVSRLKCGRFIAQIQVSGKNKNLGRFSTDTEAHAVYVEAKRKLHEGCTL